MAQLENLREVILLLEFGFLKLRLKLASLPLRQMELGIWSLMEFG